MGFSSFSSYGSKISGFGKARVALGSLSKIKTLTIAGGSGGNAIALSDDDGFTWRLPSQVPASFTRGGIAGYDGKRIVIGGVPGILYSDDLGLTWTNTGFNLIQNVIKITYIESKKIWFATGISNSIQTIAYSSNGVNWTLSNSVFNRNRCYGIEYNGNVFIAVGWGDFPTATSPDGITWTLNTTFQTGLYPFYIYNDGSRYIVIDTVYNSDGNISTSQDGITWVKNIAYLPMDIRGIAYNGVDIYVAVGTFSNVNNCYFWSNDLITWNVPNNNLLGKDAWGVEWNGTTFIIGSPIENSVNIIYSANGKDWSVSNNPFTGTVYGFKTITY